MAFHNWCYKENRSIFSKSCTHIRLFNRHIYNFDFITHEQYQTIFEQSILRLYSFRHGSNDYGLLWVETPYACCLVVHGNQYSWDSVSYFIKGQAIRERAVCLSLIYGASILLILHYLLPKKPPYGSLISYEAWISRETMIGLTVLLSCLVYRYIRNNATIQLRIIAFSRTYSQPYALASLHNQANWNR